MEFDWEKMHTIQKKKKHMNSVCVSGKRIYFLYFFLFFNWSSKMMEEFLALGI